MCKFADSQYVREPFRKYWGSGKKLCGKSVVWEKSGSGVGKIWGGKSRVVKTSSEKKLCG